MKKGFTLIELLAVIVILAIIALIATPIILGIINDAREKANERSVELYVSAVKNAIASYQLTHPTAPTSFSDLNVEYDGEVECAVEELYADGNFYVTDCSVNGVEMDYTYGTQQKQLIRYYSWSSGKIGEELPSDAEPTVAELNLSYPFYLGLDVDNNNKVIEAYTCLLKNETEYCLNPNDFAKATEIMKEAYSDILNKCTFSDSYSGCLVGDLYAEMNSRGTGFVSDSNLYAACEINEDSSFECIEY